MCHGIFVFSHLRCTYYKIILVYCGYTYVTSSPGSLIFHEVIQGACGIENLEMGPITRLDMCVWYVCIYIIPAFVK